MNLTSMKQFAAFLALAIFLVMALWMPIGMISMEHHEGMPMTNCPFMFSEVAICAMSVFEHISSWQVMTTVIPPKLVVLVLFALAAAHWFLRHMYDPPDLSPLRVYIPLRFSHASLFHSLLLESTISPRAP